MAEIGRPRTTRRPPVVLSPEEVALILCLLVGEYRLLAQLLYGTGMRINEGPQLRVKDLDFDHGAIIVREGKGKKDLVVRQPQRLVAGLREQLGRPRLLWQAGQDSGHGGVFIPDALKRKYPRAGHSWAWFWVLPQADLSADPRTGVIQRHHLYDQTFQRAFKRALSRTNICKPAYTPHPSTLVCHPGIEGW